VTREDFSEAALILLGHGTEQNAASAAPALQHAAELRRRKCFATVREAFWKQEPQVIEVLGRLMERRVFVVPLFISEGYFSDQVIPERLGFEKAGQGTPARIQQRGAQKVIYCRPVGAHAGMTKLLLSRARGIVGKFPFPRAPKPKDTSLFIAGHGTTRNENSRAPIDHQVQLLRELGLYASVHALFLDEKPEIAECYELAQTRNIVVVPFFISNGLHVVEDIPVLLGEPKRIVQQRLASGQPTWRNPTERRGKLVWYAGSVGTDPLMADLVLERVREAAEEVREIEAGQLDPLRTNHPGAV
jgi:sirohydrochlorin cobaltochelatase